MSEDLQAKVDAELQRRHDNPTPQEVAIEEACLSVHNDPRLSASEKARRIAEITSSPVGPMSRAEIYGRRDATS